MDSLPSMRSRNVFGMLVFFILVLQLYPVSRVANAATGLSAGHEYFLDEPVFGGQARIVEAGNKHAPLIVLVHGLNSSSRAWYPFIPTLAQHLHVVCFDLPGFGQSSKKNKKYSPDNYVAFIHFVLSRYPEQRIILVGHSLGGNIALRYAATYPQQVERLMLIDVAGVLHRLVSGRFLSHFGIQALPVLYPGQKQDLQSLSDGILGTLTQYSDLADFGESFILNDPGLRKDMLGAYPPAIATHAMVMTEFTNILDGFRVPTLLLWGRQDRVTPVRTGKMLAANFENAGLVIIKGAGHSPVHDTPGIFSSWLTRFTMADANLRDEILRRNRYAAPVENMADNGRIGRCSHEANRTFQGHYKRVEVDHCQGVMFRNFSADEVSLENSQAVFENCRVHSTGRGLLLENSEVRMTACRIHGSPAIELGETRLDMAGSHVISAGEAITADASAGGNEILFSISQVSSGGSPRLMHGPLRLAPGQNL